MKPQTKLDARARVAQILGAALALAPKRGYANLTRDEIAEKAGIPASLITYHMGTMPELRRHIMREAVRVRCLPVIAQGVACGDKHAMKASTELRNEALNSFTK